MSSRTATASGRTGRLGRFLRDNGLGLAFITAFLVVLVAQAFAGHAEYNNQLLTDGMARIGLGDYITSSDFGVDVMENWQSEYLQFFLYIFATVWLVQRGSPESKELHKAGRESDEDQMVGERARDDSPGWAASRGCGRAPTPAPSAWSWA